MKNNLTILFLLVIQLFLLSCHKEVQSEKGGIDLVSNVYFEASKGLDNMQSFHISKINYSGKELIELVPETTVPEINQEAYYIKDSLCYSLGTENSNRILSEVVKNQKSLLVWNKKKGAIFSQYNDVCSYLRSCKSTIGKTETFHHICIFHLGLSVQPTRRKNHCQNSIGFKRI